MATLAPVREQLRATLYPVLGDRFNLFPDPVKQIDAINKPTLVLERTRVAKLQSAPAGFFLNSMTLIVISPRPNDEDFLDGLLDDVLEVLDDGANVAWDAADRAVYKDQYPAYTITFTAHSNRKDG